VDRHEHLAALNGGRTCGDKVSADMLAPDGSHRTPFDQEVKA